MQPKEWQEDKNNEVKNTITNPIARKGESVYATILRNRSGESAGEIDYGARIFEIEKLPEGDKQNICDTAYALYRLICEHTKKKAKNDSQK